MDLQSENELLRKEVAGLTEELTRALGVIEQLSDRVRELEAQLKQDSHNSHWPSSRDKGQRQTKSLRQRSGKKAGGQPGHPGATLRLQPAADTVVAHAPTTCAACGCGLAGCVANGPTPERRQVFDLPPLTLEVTEHRVTQVTCPQCGTLNVGAFPPAVTQATQYGPEVQALGVYLNQHQLLPLQRLATVMSELFGCQLAPGSIVNWQRVAATGVAPAVASIKAALAQGDVLHCDETGFYIAGQRHWLHVHATARLTCYLPHRKRGRAGLEALGVLPTFAGVAVHDNWAAYGYYTTCRHALCNVHHLRELTYIAEEFQQAWATEMQAFLITSKAAVATARATGATALPPAQRAELTTAYQRIVDAALAANPVPPNGWPRSGKRGRPKKPKARNLAERFDAQRTKILAFLDDFTVPFDNNLAERDLRMLKVQQKISGGFRSWDGAENAAALRSYLSTMRKQGHNPLHVLRELFAGRLIAPALAG